MIEIYLNEVQFELLVKMLCTSKYSRELDLQTSLIDYIRSVDSDLFDFFHSKLFHS